MANRGAPPPVPSDPGRGRRGRGRGRRGQRRRWRDRARRSWSQRLVLLVGLVAAGLLGSAAVTLGYAYRTAEQIPRVALSSVLSQSEEEGEPQNYLLVGVDYADPNDPLAEGRDGVLRSDTIMVLRVDPAERHAELLSMPRDLWVPYGDGDSNRINTAIQRGNGRPDVLIELLNNYFGIPIHHFVQVDFSGFRDLVTVIDGVPIYFPYPARDRHSGLYVEQTGCVTLNPDQALAYARSRYYEQFVDGEWDSDPTADLGRVQRQQEFIRASIARAFARGARNPGTLNDLANAALDAVQVDDTLTVGDIVDLAGQFRSFDPSELVTYSLPVVGDTTAGGASILRLVEAQAESILAEFRGDGDELSPVSVRLTVLNGSGISGQGQEASGALVDAGFTVVGTDQSSSYDGAQTTIRYPEGQLAQAELLSRWLVSGAVLEEVPAVIADAGDGSTGDTTGTEVDETDGSTGIVLVTGSDWGGVLSEPRSGDTATTDTTDTTDDTTGDTTGDETGGAGADLPDRRGDTTPSSTDEPSSDTTTEPADDESSTTTSTTVPAQQC